MVILVETMEITKIVRVVLGNFIEVILILLEEHVQISQRMLMIFFVLVVQKEMKNAVEN